MKALTAFTVLSMSLIASSAMAATYSCPIQAGDTRSTGEIKVKVDSKGVTAKGTYKIEDEAKEVSVDCVSFRTHADFAKQGGQLVIENNDGDNHDWSGKNYVYFNCKK